MLIALNAGTDCVGVRPGYDALRLAQAMQELKGLNAIGLATNLTRQQNNELAETVSAIRHTENLLTQNSLAVSRVMLCDFALSHSTDSLIRTGATDLILYDGRDMGRTDLAVGPSNPAGNATVISRPSLSTAVIDIGRFSLWPDAGPVCVRVTRPQGATVLQIDEFTTALGLAGNALDLRIGDQLEWKVEHSDWILKPNSY